MSEQMMTNGQQLKLQAFLDGELPEGEQREVAAWVARDAEAAALLSELRNTRQALARFEPAVTLPETREFYWSKIERDIRRLEAGAPRAVAPRGWWRRLAMPLSAAAALLVIAFVTSLQLGVWRPVSRAATTEMTADAGANAFTYRDDTSGTTLVWVSYPSER